VQRRSRYKPHVSKFEARKSTLAEHADDVFLGDFQLPRDFIGAHELAAVELELLRLLALLIPGHEATSLHADGPAQTLMSATRPSAGAGRPPRADCHERGPREAAC
jgi:hypothetical protein